MLNVKEQKKRNSMHLVVDGIIEKLQTGGGCSVYFSEILQRYIRDGYDLRYLDFLVDGSQLIKGSEKVIFDKYHSRQLERWRDVNCKPLTSDAIFHSTHYRLPVEKAKIVTTVHDFTYELYRKGPGQWMHTWQKNRAIKNSDLVLCVSNNTAKDLLKFCPISEDKIRVVHNGVSDTYHCLEDVGSSNEVVFIGARGGYKNFILAVKAVARVAELSLSIVGGGQLTETELKYLKTYLPGRHQWLGRLSDEQLNVVYNRAFCLIYPSSYEGFGIPVAEAMRAGCPVIAVNSSSIPEVAGDAGLLVKIAETSLFSDALQQLLIERNREGVIKQGLLQSQKFSWENCYQETLKVYEELI